MAYELKGPLKRRAETREKLVSTAQKLFSKNGYHNTQVMDIVKDARVSAGTFYNYFRDKRDIFGQLMDETLAGLRMETKKFRQLPKEIMDLSRQEQKKIINGRILKIYENIFDFADKYPHQMLMTLRGIFGVDGDLDDTAVQFNDAMARDFVEDMEQWERLLQIKIDINKFILAHIVLGSAFQVAQIYLTTRSFTRKEAIETLAKSFQFDIGTLWRLDL
jgi:AcrR family transcriptional regulator